MNKGDVLVVEGYHVIAQAECDHGSVMVLHNNSSHFFVIDTAWEDRAQGVIREIYQYAGPGSTLSSRECYQAALQLMTKTVLEHTSDCDEFDDAPEDDDYPCPTCGCKPGDGVTAGCTDPDGCGFEGGR